MLPGPKNALRVLDSTLKLPNVLLYLLQLLLLCHKFLGNEVQIVSSFVFLHNLKHVLKVFSKFLIMITNPKFLFVFDDLNLNAFFGQWHRRSHNFVRMIAELDSTSSKLVTQVIKRDYFRVLYLLA